MAWDDTEPRHRKPVLVDLGPMSVADLRSRIVEYEAEIERMRKAIEAKEAQKNSADALFRK